MDFEKDTRWLVVREKGNYGPFLVNDIKDAINKGDIDLNTVLMEVNTKRQCSLSQIKFFYLYYTEHKRYEEKRKESQLIAIQAKKLRDRHKMLSIMPMTLGILLLLFIVIGIFLITKVEETANAELEDSIFKNLQFERIPKWREFDESKPGQAKMAEYMPNIKKAVHRVKVSSKKTGANSIAGANGSEEDSVIEMDFTGEDPSGAALEASEIDRIAKEAKATVKECISVEFKNNSDLKRITVRFAISPKGKISGISLDGGEAQVSGFAKNCSASVLSRINVQPFDGDTQYIEIPFFIQ
jgi:hypothetical protein